jgi:hypothetical protein
LQKAAGIAGRTFYDLRRTFQTIAEGAHDLTAVQAIMGHAPRQNDMSAVYRQRIEPARLEAVTGYVRAWLWPQTISIQSAGFLCLYAKLLGNLRRRVEPPWGKLAQPIDYAANDLL